MAALPTTRTATSTEAEHLADHAELATKHNVTEGAWTAYAPVLTASTTNPTIGNGSLTGRYCKIGRLVHVIISFVFGSTSTAGNGAWAVTLPFIAQTFCDQVLPAKVLDAGTDNILAAASVSPGGHITGIIYEGGNVVGSAQPMVWANGDNFVISGTYEAAS